ncbi:MAG: hypothetical protein LBO66_04820 [Deltaproteobacteria bacterium]|jgi:hypothetical protein|nr:hypothetical protein [Deltaproteobacteria bacterium]
MTKPPSKNPPAKFDRTNFFKEVREDCLKRLGLPENTRPDRVLQLLELREKIDKLNGDKAKKSGH